MSVAVPSDAENFGVDKIREVSSGSPAEDSEKGRRWSRGTGCTSTVPSLLPGSWMSAPGRPIFSPQRHPTFHLVVRIGCWRYWYMST